MSKKPPGRSSVFSEFEKQAVSQYSKQIYDLVYRAQYRQAFDVAKKLKSSFPDNRFAQYHYAVALGDCGEWASPNTEKKNAKIAAKLLRNLLMRSRGIDPQWRRAWRNEYYWFSGQFYKQWCLGRELVRAGQPKARYSMGVGAVSLSFQFLSKGEGKRGKLWAQRAQKAWEEYFKFVSDYYNAYVWYAQALGLQGDIKGMEKSLKRAAMLSKRSLSYREFVEARDKVLKAVSLDAEK